MNRPTRTLTVAAALTCIGAASIPAQNMLRDRPTAGLPFLEPSLPTGATFHGVSLVASPILPRPSSACGFVPPDAVHLEICSG